MRPQARLLRPASISFRVDLRSATRDSARAPLININATVFAAKAAVFLRPGPASENSGHPIGRSGWQCPAGPISRVRACKTREFKGGAWKKRKQNGAP